MYSARLERLKLYYQCPVARKAVIKEFIRRLRRILPAAAPSDTKASIRRHVCMRGWKHYAFVGIILLIVGANCAVGVVLLVILLSILLGG